MKRGAMKRLLVVAGMAMMLSPLGTTVARAESAEEQIAQAVMPLPEDLRAGATVFMYDKATGDRKVLREGTNTVECSPKNPEDGFTRCWSKVTAGRRDFQAKLKAQKKSDQEIREAMAAAEKAGTIKPAPFASMSYRLTDNDKQIKLLWIMAVPGATTETLGVSTTSQRDAALKGQGKPWLMLAGTPGAHVMIPIHQ